MSDIVFNNVTEESIIEKYSIIFRPSTPSIAEPNISLSNGSLIKAFYESLINSDFLKLVPKENRKITWAATLSNDDYFDLVTDISNVLVELFRSPPYEIVNKIVEALISYLGQRSNAIDYSTLSSRYFTTFELDLLTIWKDFIDEEVLSGPLRYKSVIQRVNKFDHQTHLTKKSSPKSKRLHVFQFKDRVDELNTLLMRRIDHGTYCLIFGAIDARCLIRYNMNFDIPILFPLLPAEIFQSETINRFKKLSSFSTVRSDRSKAFDNFQDIFSNITEKRYLRLPSFMSNLDEQRIENELRAHTMRAFSKARQTRHFSSELKSVNDHLVEFSISGKSQDQSSPSKQESESNSSSDSIVGTGRFVSRRRRQKQMLTEATFNPERRSLPQAVGQRKVNLTLLQDDLDPNFLIDLIDRSSVLFAFRQDNIESPDPHSHRVRLDVTTSDPQWIHYSELFDSDYVVSLNDSHRSVRFLLTFGSFNNPIFNLVVDPRRNRYS